MTYEFGQVVLVWFPQSEHAELKRRPAMVILDIEDDDLVLAPITSVKRSGPGDVVLNNWREGGLARASWVRLGKLAAVKKTLVERELGKISRTDRARIVVAWRELFGF